MRDSTISAELAGVLETHRGSDADDGRAKGSSKTLCFSHCSLFELCRQGRRVATFTPRRRVRPLLIILLLFHFLWLRGDPCRVMEGGKGTGRVVAVYLGCFIKKLVRVASSVVRAHGLAL